MPDKCPRCGREMEAIAAWWPVKINDEDPELEYVVHVCGQCYKDAELIDKAFAEACAKAKYTWLYDTSIELSDITSIQSVRNFLAKVEV